MTTQTFKGKKLEKLMEEIEQNTNQQYKIVKQKEMMRNPFLFWMKKYEIEIEVLEEKETTEKQISELNKNVHLKQMKQMKEIQEHPHANFSEKKRKILDMLEENDMKVPHENLKGDQGKQMEMMQKMIEDMMKKMEEKSKTEEVKEEIGFLKSENEKIMYEYYEKLTDTEIRTEIAEMILIEVKTRLKEEDWLNNEKVEAEVLKIMTEKLDVTGELPLDEIKIIALIGPTGVGKTTTIAKIAGYMADKKKKVGLITTDVFRIGATDQLQIYANILDSEMIAVNSPEELEAAIEKLTYEYKVDQILIDTVGRSPLDVDSIDDIKEYLEIANPDHIGLVLSSTQKTKDVRKILENFRSVSINSLLFTKLDETINHGVMLNAVVDGEVKISYITNGQNVPYDIYQADSHALAKKILNGVDEFGSSIFSA